MHNKNDQSLFYKRKSRQKIVIIAILGVLTLIGITTYAMGNVMPEASANSPSPKEPTNVSTEVQENTNEPIADTEALEEILNPDAILSKASLKSKIATIDPSVSTFIETYQTTLKVDGIEKQLTFIGEASVEDLISKAGITITDQDVVSEPLTKLLANGDTINITRVRTVKEESIVETPYETIYQDDDTLYEGTSKLVQDGKNNIIKEIYSITYHNEEEVGRRLEKEEIIQEGADEIIAIGTLKEPEPEPSQDANEDGSITNVSADSSGDASTAESRSGSTGEFDYSDVITCTAFAYTAPKGAIGASGNPAVEGTCAVDPSVIPLGTKLYIEGYGYATANDTGSAIIGNTVDVFMDSYTKACSWGRQTVKVYILS